MKTITILTCVLGEPPELIDTYNSLEKFLNNAFTWVIKFDSTASSKYIEKLRKEYINCIQLADNSLYQAMNQGLSLIETEYYFVLGAGDRLAGGELIELWRKSTETSESSYFFSIKLARTQQVLSPNPNELAVRMACPHPGSILRTKNSLEIGGFDLKYEIASDYDHLSRYVKKYGSGQTYTNVLVDYLGGGLSERRAIEGYLEEELVRKRVWGAHDYAVYSRMITRTAGLTVGILKTLSADLR